MEKKKPENFEYNRKALLAYCDERGYECHQFDNQYQFRVMGDTAMIDVWPSRMKVHVIASEYPELTNDYRQLSFELSPSELDDLLNGSGLISRKRLR